MASFEITVDVARLPAEVFAYLTDVSKLPEWQATASEAELDGAVGQGARIRERRHFLGRDLRTELEVTAYEPPARDCYGEKSSCENSCRDAQTDCEFSCAYCSSCTSDLTDAQCQDRCRQCREGCKQNEVFCESGCSHGYDRCTQ